MGDETMIEQLRSESVSVDEATPYAAGQTDPVSAADGVTDQAATPHKESPEQRGPTPLQQCEAMVEQGDLQGLLDHLQSKMTHLLHLSPDLLARCIRRKARLDLSALTEDAFASILSLGLLLLLRTKLFIESRLQECEAHGAHALSQLPRDLLAEGWLERAERQARFVAEMASLRARTRHVSGLDDETRRSNRRRRRRPGSAVGEDRGEAPAGKTSSDNGGLRFGASAARTFAHLGGALP